VKVVRRGTVGMALFVSGVLSIPAVIAADCHSTDDGETSLAASSTQFGRTPRPSLTDSPGAPGTPGAPGAPPTNFGAALGDAAQSTPTPSNQLATQTAATAGPSGFARAKIRGFAGVTPGAIVSGQIQIRAIVAGTLNAVTYTLDGSVLISYDSLWQPYLFSPDGLGLDTTKIPNGVYTLTAMPRDSNAIPASITFQVANPGRPVLASGSGLHYYVR
jgi:hypothetical protein